MYLARHCLYSWRTFCLQLSFLALLFPSLSLSLPPLQRRSLLEGKDLEKVNDQTGKSHFRLMFIYVFSLSPQHSTQDPTQVCSFSCYKCQNVPLSNFLTGVNTDTPTLGMDYVKDKKSYSKKHFKNCIIRCSDYLGTVQNL